MSLKVKNDRGKDETIYETIWREIVEIYPFIEKSDDKDSPTLSAETKEEANL